MKQQKRKLVVAGIVLVSGGVLLATTLNTAALTRQLHTWKLLPEPERLTELYFANHATLPNTYVPGQTQQFAFTVHNLEYRTTTYTYQIIEQDESGGQTQLLASGSFTLAHGKYRTTPEVVNLTDLGPRAKVVVNLRNTQESIDYLVSNAISKGGSL